MFGASNGVAPPASQNFTLTAQATTAAASDKPINNNPRAVPARVHSTFGAVVAVDDLGMERKLAAGSPVYAGERVRTDAAGPAALVFTDQTRVVIDRKSEFKLDAYRYAPDRPQADNFAVSLVKGGVRFLTGLLGKRNGDKIVVRTVTATIGVRGTNFDLVCAPAGLADPGDPPPASLDGAPCDDGALGLCVDAGVVICDPQNPAKTISPPLRMWPISLSTISST